MSKSILKEKIKQHNGILMRPEVLLNKKLNAQDKLFYEILCNLYAFDECTLTNKEIGKFFGCTERNVFYMLAKLKKLGLIKIIGETRQRVIFPVF